MLIDIVESYFKNNIKNKSKMNKEVISISDTSSSEDIKTENKNFKIKNIENIYENIKTKDEIIDIKENKENANILEDRYKEEIVLLKREIDSLKNTIKITEETLPSPSKDDEKQDKIPGLSISHHVKKNNKFFNKSLPILERCNIIAYNYDFYNNKSNEILQFLSSERKVVTKFNSIVADKIGKDDDIWKDI